MKDQWGVTLGIVLLIGALAYHIERQASGLEEVNSAIKAGVLALFLVAGGGVFYAMRQRSLKRQISDRTLELQQLNEQLEERIQRRTQELDRERARLKVILDAMGDGLIYHENDAVQYTNQALCDLLGYPAEELIGPLSAYYEKVTGSPDGYAGRECGTWRGIAQFRRRDGSLIDVEVSMSGVCDGNGKPVGRVDVIRDISQQKTLQDQKDRFIAHASHEFRTPLSNIKTRLYLLRHQPNRVAEHVDVIERVSDHMTELLNDLLDASRFERNEIVLSTETIKLQDLLIKAINVQRPDAERKRIRMVCELTEKPVYITGDVRRLTQAFTNVLVNAINYTPETEQICITLSRELDSDPPWAVIHVQDTGPGITPELLPHIFEPFSRPSEGKTISTGLGLSIARQVIEKHGGTIIAESVPGRGTTVTIRLAVQPHNGSCIGTSPAG